MINEPPPFKGLKTGIPITILTKGRGLINRGATVGLGCMEQARAQLGLAYRVLSSCYEILAWVAHMKGLGLQVTTS